MPVFLPACTASCHLSKLLSVCLLITLYLNLPHHPTAQAQTNISGIAISLNTPTSLSTQAGLLICQQDSVFKLCDQPNSTQVVGVTTLEPDIQIETSTNPNQTLVIQSGLTPIQVTTANGPIAKNDPLTSSNIEGLAQKATGGQAIIAIAQSDLDSSLETGLVTAQLNLSLAGLNSSQGRQGLDSIPTFLRALLAALVVITTIVISAISFKKTSHASMEALGRNPLANRSIQSGLVINTIATAAFAFVGLAAGYVIVVL